MDTINDSEGVSKAKEENPSISTKSPYKLPEVLKQYSWGQPLSNPVEDGRKGGLSKSPRKKYAAQLRGMKRKGMTNADVDWFCKRIEDPEISVFHMQKWIDSLLPDLKPSQQTRLIDLSIQLHKAHHGEKIKRENLNVNIDVDYSKLINNAWEKRKLENKTIKADYVVVDKVEQ